MAKQSPIATSYAALVRDGGNAYREAIAMQVAGVDATDAWERWENDTAALLLLSWAAGAANSLKTAGVPVPDKVPTVVQFERGDPEFVLKFQPGPAREVVRRFAELLPITRRKWDTLVASAFASAAELRHDEQANALTHILNRSPELSALMNNTGVADRERTALPKRLAPEARQRMTPEAQAVAQGTFFVTGMNLRQIEQTKDLLAKAIRGEITTSVAGKKLEDLGVGDFAAHVKEHVLDVGTDLTEARLETVYRTNMNRAQTQGRLDICRDPEVRRFVPLMQFRATKDKRTRDTHRQFAGYVATVDQIDTLGIPAPLGFNCRCSWTPVSIATAFDNGWCDEDGNPNMDAIKKHNGNRQRLIESGMIPDPGFIAG